MESVSTRSRWHVYVACTRQLRLRVTSASQPNTWTMNRQLRRTSTSAEPGPAGQSDTPDSGAAQASVPHEPTCVPRMCAGFAGCRSAPGSAGGLDGLEDDAGHDRRLGDERQVPGADVDDVGPAEFVVAGSASRMLTSSHVS